MKWQEMTYPCSSSADGNLFSVREEIKRSNKKRYSEIPHAFSEEAKLVTYLSFFFLNTEARPKYDIKKAWSHYRAHWWRSTGRSLLSQRWADYQLWNNSRLALPPTTTTPPNKTPLVTRVHGLPISTSDWMLWFYLSSAASSGSWWQKWQLFAFNTLSLLHGSYNKKKTTKKKMLCLCLSRTTARHCWDAPKSFYLWTLWHWRGLWLFFSFF